MDALTQMWAGLTMPGVWPVVMFVLGSMVGSFLNVVSLRMPARLEWSWRQQARQTLDPEATLEDAPINWTTDHSRCPHCQHRLSFWENLPIVGYLALRGRCRSCKARISPRYLVVELVTAGLFLAAALTQPPALSLLAGGFCATLLALALIDAKTFILPDQITLPLMWAGLLLGGHAWVTPSQALWGAALGWFFLWAVFWLFKLVTGKEGMGYGDFKLLAAIGAFLGPVALLPVLLGSSVAGAAFGIWARLQPQPALQSDDVPAGAFPFGPFLAMGGILALFTRPLWQSFFNIPG